MNKKMRQEVLKDKDTTGQPGVANSRHPLGSGLNDVKEKGIQMLLTYFMYVKGKR